MEPHGAEFAEPGTHIQLPPVEGESEPDPESRVHLDDRGLIDVETVLIPPVPHPGVTVRVHLILTPDSGLDAHWNNEAGHGELWIEPPPDWVIDQRHQILPAGLGDVSDETRRVEFEVAVPPGANTSGGLGGYLLYCLCEGVSGVCVYRRRDLEISIPTTNDHGAVDLAG